MTASFYTRFLDKSFDWIMTSGLRIVVISIGVLLTGVANVVYVDQWVKIDHLAVYG